jgi:hypothetical protein
MPQTTDQTLEALIEESDGAWHEDVFHIGGPELMALLRRAAVPLVAEAPREPLCFISSKQLPQLATRSSMYLPYSLCLVGNFDTPLYAAVPTSLAPMPEECSVSQWSSRCCERGTKGCTVSHLRTAPIPTMSDEQIKRIWLSCKSVDNEAFCIEFARAVLASVAPQPEQPKPDAHLAANRESAVHGLDAAAGVQEVPRG